MAISRRAQKKQNTKDRLIDGVQQLLSRQSIEDTSVDAIAALAGISKKTFYNYYPSKQDVIEDLSQILLISTSESHYTQAMQKFDNTRDRLNYYLDMQGLNLNEQPILKHNLIRHALLDLSTNSTRSQKKLANTIDIYERLFNAGADLGDINDKYSPRFLAEMVAGTLNTTAIHWLHFTEYPVNQRFFEIKKLVLDISLKS